MAVHYILPDDDDGSPLDAEILAIYAKLEAHAEASLKPPQIDPVERATEAMTEIDPVERATEAMTEIAVELLLRAQSWALLHFRCAVARGLPSGSAAFVEAADTFAELIDEARAYGLSEGISQAARDACWAAFEVTGRESDHKLPDEFRRLCREAKLRELGIEEEELTDDLAWKLGHLCREAMFAELCKQPGFAQLHEAEASPFVTFATR